MPPPAFKPEFAAPAGFVCEPCPAVEVDTRELEARDAALLEQASTSWLGLVREAARYPLRGENRIGILVAGAVVLVVSISMFTPPIGIIVAAGGLAYMSAYYFEG